MDQLISAKKNALNLHEYLFHLILSHLAIFYLEINEMKTYFFLSKLISLMRNNLFIQNHLQISLYFLTFIKVLYDKDD